MLELTRRKFTAATVAIIAVAAAPPLLATPDRPEIGTQFFTVTWVYADSQNAAWLKVFDCKETEMRRIERTRGLILGRNTGRVSFDKGRGAWCCVRQATVVDYA